MVKETLEVRAKKSTPVAEVVYYTGDILGVYFYDDVTIGIADIHELVYATLELTGGETGLLNLIVTGERNNISTEAFSYNVYKELKIKQRTIAEAVVISNLPTRIMANFYYKAVRRRFPVKVFDSERAAIEWLFKVRKGKS